MDIDNPPGLHWHSSLESSGYSSTSPHSADTQAPYLRPEDGTGTRLGRRMDPECPVLCLSEQLPAGSIRTPHSHPRAQLAWAASGVLKVNTASGSWIVPPSHAVWIASNMEHEIQVVSDASIGYLFVDVSVTHRLPDQCLVLTINPLMRELILKLASLDLSPPMSSKTANLIEVVLDQLGEQQASPLHLPGGRDRRLQAVMDLLTRDPATSSNLQQLASAAGASPRTIERLFQNETGMSFRQWRTRLKLLEAVQRLGDGESSAAIALSLGYSSSSAFVAAFKKNFGVPPQRFSDSG